MTGKVRIGVVGTSWWADAMYLPALTAHPLADVRGVAGTRPAHTREFATRWGVPGAYDSVEDLFAAGPLDAVVILVPNRLHHPIAMAAIERGLHVLCEKPLGLTAAEAREMTDAAERAGIVTMCPFTYRFMPLNTYLKELVDEGYLGRPYHLDMRYFAGYGRGGEYAWRFDTGEAGAGVGGDLGSHWTDLARWWFGEIDAVTAVFGHSLARGPRPDGAPYEQAEDSALLLIEFASGATGSIHVSAVALEPSPFGQFHGVELHGSEGTLRGTCDWDRVQRVDGARTGEPAIHELPIPDRIFAGARRSPVTDTYKDVFRKHDVMARGFVSAIASGMPAAPDFRDGLAVQRVVDAAVRSGREGRRVTIAEIQAGER
jgi:predicted dehydrogenase